MEFTLAAADGGGGELSSTTSRTMKFNYLNCYIFKRVFQRKNKYGGGLAVIFLMAYYFVSALTPETSGAT